MNYCYQIISDFFNAYSLSHATALLFGSLQAANKGKIWKGRTSADLLYFFKKLEELLLASFDLVNDSSRREGAMIENNAEGWFLTDYKNYCGWHVDSTPWDFFPRNLTQKEFLDPWKALKKITRYGSVDEWKEYLYEILYHAMARYSINEEEINLLEVRLLLHKLLEASHLIEIRAIHEDEDGSRPKWKDRAKILAKRQQAGTSPGNDKSQPVNDQHKTTS